MVHNFRRSRIRVKLAVNLYFFRRAAAFLVDHGRAGEPYIGHQARPDHDSKVCCRPLASTLPILGQFEAARRRFCQLLCDLCDFSIIGRDQQYVYLQSIRSIQVPVLQSTRKCTKCSGSTTKFSTPVYPDIGLNLVGLHTISFLCLFAITCTKKNKNKKNTSKQ